MLCTPGTSAARQAETGGRHRGRASGFVLRREGLLPIPEVCTNARRFVPGTEGLYQGRKVCSREAVGGTSGTVGGSRETVGGTSGAVGGSREAVGGTSEGVGGGREGVGGCREAPGGTRQPGGPASEAAGGRWQRLGGGERMATAARPHAKSSRSSRSLSHLRFSSYFPTRNTLPCW